MLLAHFNIEIAIHHDVIPNKRFLIQTNQTYHPYSSDVKIWRDTISKNTLKLVFAFETTFKAGFLTYTCFHKYANDIFEAAQVESKTWSEPRVLDAIIDSRLHCTFNYNSPPSHLGEVCFPANNEGMLCIDLLSKESSRIIFSFTNYKL